MNQTTVHRVLPTENFPRRFQAIINGLEFLHSPQFFKTLCPFVGNLSSLQGMPLTDLNLMFCKLIEGKLHVCMRVRSVCGCYLKASNLFSE